MIQRAVIPALVLAVATLIAVVVLLLEHLAVPEAIYAVLALSAGGVLGVTVPNPRGVTVTDPGVAQPETPAAKTTPATTTPAGLVPPSA